MNYQCPYGCTEPLRSEKQYNNHLCFRHEAYENGERVSEATIKTLEKVKDRVLFLLLKFKECRRPDNGDLYIKYLCCWTNSLIYDAKEKAYALNDQEAPRNFAKHHSLRWALAQLETVRRQRELLQSTERRKIEHIERVEHRPAVVGKDYLDILPDPVQQALADVREEIMRSEMSQNKYND